jgi:hypothetical protein
VIVGAGAYLTGFLAYETGKFQTAGCMRRQLGADDKPNSARFDSSGRQTRENGKSKAFFR